MINRVKTYREQKQIPQIELAKQIGISRQTLSQIESNKKLPNLELALKISNLLNVSVETLFSENHEDGSKKITALSQIERLLLANQYKILQQIHRHDSRSASYYRHEELVFERGYVYLYQESFDKLVREFDVTVSEEVVSILDLHRAMLWSLGNEPQPEDIERTKFRGFDAVNEPSHLSFARFFVAERQNYNDLTVVNSSTATLHRYRKMLACWTEMERKPKLSEKDIAKILQAGQE